MAELTQLEMINGIGILLILILLLYIGLRLLLKYISLKDKNFILLACVFFFQAKTWVAPTIFFISLLSGGPPISLELFLLISHVFNYSGLFWIILLTRLMFRDKQKLILSLIGIFFIVSEIIFLYLFFTNISMLGSLPGFLQFQQGPYLIIRNVLIMILALSFTIMFYRQSHKSDNPEIRLRGTLFLAAFILIIMGGISHMITGQAFVILIFIIFSSICYYTALLTPEWMKKRLIKETE